MQKQKMGKLRQSLATANKANSMPLLWFKPRLIVYSDTVHEGAKMSAGGSALDIRAVVQQ